MTARYRTKRVGESHQCQSERQRRRDDPGGETRAVDPETETQRRDAYSKENENGRSKKLG